LAAPFNTVHCPVQAANLILHEDQRRRSICRGCRPVNPLTASKYVILNRSKPNLPKLWSVGDHKFKTFKQRLFLRGVLAAALQPRYAALRRDNQIPSPKARHTRRGIHGPTGYPSCACSSAISSAKIRRTRTGPASLLINTGFRLKKSALPIRCCRRSSKGPSSSTKALCIP